MKTYQLILRISNGGPYQHVLATGSLATCRKVANKIIWLQQQAFRGSAVEIRAGWDWALLPGMPGSVTLFVGRMTISEIP